MDKILNEIKAAGLGLHLSDAEIIAIVVAKVRKLDREGTVVGKVVNKLKAEGLGQCCSDAEITALATSIAVKKACAEAHRARLMRDSAKLGARLNVTKAPRLNAPAAAPAKRWSYLNDVIRAS